MKRESGEPSHFRARAQVAEPSRSPLVSHRRRERGARDVAEQPTERTSFSLGSSEFGDLLIERRRRREALDAHIASLSSIQRAGMLAMVRSGLGLRDRDWQSRYDELVAALEEVERAVHKALGVMDIAPHSEHAVRVGG